MLAMETLKIKKVKKFFMYAIALAWTAFQLYSCFKAGVGIIALRGCHVSFALSFVFLMKPLGGEDQKPLLGVLDLACTIYMLCMVAYFWIQNDYISQRLQFYTPVETVEMILGVIFVILLLESCRRMLGYSMLIVALVFIAYILFGSGLPGIFTHSGVTFTKFIEMQFLGTYGIMGSAAGISADTIFYFMIFGAFLAATPAGKLFISVARFATRRAVGGDGKTMIIACGLFGMTSGSAAANVASVGSLTYKPMVEADFDPVFSASTLAIAGSGGQLIPPVMGSAAFLMADFLRCSYWDICVYAIIPSLLYIFSLYMVIHFEAKRRGIGKRKIDAKEFVNQVKAYAYLVLPLVLLVVLIAMGRTVRVASVISTGLLIVLTSIKKESRLSVQQFIDTILEGAKSACVVAVPCAVSGILVGVLTYTSLGLRLSSLIAQVAGINLILGLLLSMVLIIIMGMGLPTTAAYIMSATLLAGAFGGVGLDLVVIHFFIFYFANLSMITPPVALASYTAAGLAGTPFWETGIKAFKYSFVVFLIPFCFVYNPALLAIGNALEIVWAVVPTMLGIMAVAMGVIGFYRKKFSLVFRGLLIVCGICTIVPETITTLMGIVGIAAIAATQMLDGKGKPAVQ